MRYWLLLILSLVTAQPVLAQGFSPWTQGQFFNCVPSIKPGPLTQGLGFLWIGLGGLQFDLVNGAYGVNTGPFPTIPYHWGEQLNTSFGGVSFENEPAVVTTDNGAGTGGFSLLVKTYAPPDASSNGYLLSFGNSGNIVWMTANNLAGSAGVQGNGEVGVWTYDGTNIVNYSTPQSTLDGNIYTIIATVSNSAAWKLYFNGVAKPFTLATGPSTYASVKGTKAGVGSYHDGSLPAGNNTSIMMDAEFNRILTPAEINVLSLNPESSLLQCPR